VAEDAPDESHPDNLSNRVFGLPLLEMRECAQCGGEVAAAAGSDHFIYYAYISTVLQAGATGGSFESALRRSFEDERKSCPRCDRPGCVVRQHLVAEPEVFSVGLVWPMANPPVADIIAAMNAVPQEVVLAHIFSPYPGRPVRGLRYRLKGVISYYGLHYDCFFFNPLVGQWIVFDDERVVQAGARWEDLVDRGARGHSHPSVLFYEAAPESLAAIPAVSSSAVAAPRPAVCTPAPAPTPARSPAPSAPPVVHTPPRIPAEGSWPEPSAPPAFLPLEPTMSLAPSAPTAPPVWQELDFPYAPAAARAPISVRTPPSPSPSLLPPPVLDDLDLGYLQRGGKADSSQSPSRAAPEPRPVASVPPKPVAGGLSNLAQLMQSPSPHERPSTDPYSELKRLIGGQH
jgi:hypothetical protein